MLAVKTHTTLSTVQCDTVQCQRRAAAISIYHSAAEDAKQAAMDLLKKDELYRKELDKAVRRKKEGAKQIRLSRREEYRVRAMLDMLYI